MKSIVKTVATLAVIGAALYFTNPTMADFGKYYERKQVAASQKGVTGVIGDIMKAVAQTGADLAVKVGYRRDDKLLFSFFTLGPASKPAERFIGMAKVIFIQVK